MRAVGNFLLRIAGQIHLQRPVPAHAVQHDGSAFLNLLQLRPEASGPAVGCHPQGQHVLRGAAASVAGKSHLESGILPVPQGIERQAVFRLSRPQGQLSVQLRPAVGGSNLARDPGVGFDGQQFLPNGWPLSLQPGAAAPRGQNLVKQGHNGLLALGNLQHVVHPLDESL